MSLQIVERQAGDVTILDLQGKIKHGDGVVTLRRSFFRLLEERKRKILLNFDGVRKIDDSSLADLKNNIHAVEKEGGEVRAEFVYNIKDVNEITRLAMLLNCHGSEAEALNAFR